MKRLLVWVPVMLVAASAAACRHIPRQSDIQQPSTQVTVLSFGMPDGGTIEAKADLLVFSKSGLSTKVESLEATLYVKGTAVGKGRTEDGAWIPSLDSKVFTLEFEDLDVAGLEKALGRVLGQGAIETFEVDGVIVYETQEGALQQPFPKSSISCYLGPKGTRT